MPGLSDDDPGEILHELGKAGARRAKVWLDSTTRIESSWSVYDSFGKNRLTYPWPHGGKSYSYDLGGVFHGGDLHQQSFLVECKKYSNPGQGGHFDKFLAQSYALLTTYPMLGDHFVWITWHPFRITTWSELYSEDKIVEAILAERERVFGLDATSDDEVVKALIDRDAVATLARTCWVIVLSDKQETLVISREDRAEVMRLRDLRDEN